MKLISGVRKTCEGPSGAVVFNLCITCVHAACIMGVNPNKCMCSERKGIINKMGYRLCILKQDNENKWRD